MDNKEIQNLVRFLTKSGISEFKMETKEIKLSIKTPEGSMGKSIMSYPSVPQVMPPSAPQVVQSAPPAESSSAGNASQEKKSSENVEENNKNLVTIKSPIIGTFYRKPSPDKPVFVEVGQTIKEGDPLCVIEAMKLFNEIEAEQSGKIVKILVDDSTPVEFDQPLFLLDIS